MKNIGFSQVNITGGLMGHRQKTNREATVHAVYDRFCDTGRFDPYFTDEAKRAENYPKNLHVFYDSDVVKLIEGAAYLLKDGSTPELEAMIKLVEDAVERNSDPNGYFNSYFTNNEPENKFTARNLHELYTAGHLFEAAVAVYEMTGNRRLLDCSCRFADLIEKVFKEEKSAKFLTPGHEEIELALVRLYHATNEKRYLELAKYFVDIRGNEEELSDAKKYFPAGRYSQAHLPARDQRTAEGHCVRACYFYSAMADIAREYNDQKLFAACKAIYEDIVTGKLYITGGIGQTRVGESFDRPYNLPNESAYNETCAGISLAMFARRMSELELDSQYADLVELLIYNAILSGVSLDGTSFFYENPLELDPARHKMADWANPDVEKLPPLPQLQRLKVFSCSCCPPNICRFFASIGDYAYGKDDDTYYVHQYFNGNMADGDVRIEVETNYPAENVVKITAENTGNIAVRIPGWCKSFTIDRDYTMKAGYAVVEGDGAITLTFDMPVTLITANHKVRMDRGCAALKRGPIVYCIESVDNGADLTALCVNPNLNETLTFNEEFGAYTIETDGCRIPDSDQLYYTLGSEPAPVAVRLKYIPYFAFANRGITEMSVWVRLM